MADPDVGGATLNIQAVAAAAGVSKTTVSHVLSGRRPVAAATRERVLAVMAELDFRPNFFARALATQRSRSIALFTQDITNPFYPALARGVQHGLQGDDHALMLLDAAVGNLGDCVDVVIERMVDGAILAVAEFGPAGARLGRAGLPVVTVGFPPPDASFDAVSADDEGIATDAVAHLHARGHKRVALVNGPSIAAPGAARRKGFHATKARLGLPLDPALEADADWTRDGGAAATAQLLDLPDPPTAAFCANDLMAIGALDAAFTRGLRVPEDLAVVGVDDIDAAGLVRPALTTVALNADAMGRVAAALLLRRLRGDASPPERVVIPHRLVERKST